MPASVAPTDCGVKLAYPMKFQPVLSWIEVDAGTRPATASSPAESSCTHTAMVRESVVRSAQGFCLSLESQFLPWPAGFTYVRARDQATVWRTFPTLQSACSRGIEISWDPEPRDRANFPPWSAAPPPSPPPAPSSEEPTQSRRTSSRPGPASTAGSILGAAGLGSRTSTPAQSVPVDPLLSVTRRHAECVLFPGSLGVVKVWVTTTPKAVSPSLKVQKCSTITPSRS